MELKQFGRKAFQVEGLQVTRENMEEVAAWCGGLIEEQSSRGNSEFYIKVPVHRPVNDKQTKAFVTDWVLKSPTGFKVYVDRAFQNSFEEQPIRRNVFEQAAEVQALADKANEAECDNCGFTKPVTVIDKDRKICRKCAKELEVETTRESLGFASRRNLMEG